MLFKSNSAKIALAAISSRAVCLLIGLVSAHYMHPYDTSGNIYPAGQGSLGKWLSPLGYWDGVYFLRTADIEGYEYEHTHAFFPGLPILINVVEGFVSSVLPEWALPVQRVDRLLLCGAVITNISFILASVLLYWLGLAVLSDRKDGMTVAFYGALFFSIPISNIFMSAIYTESLYSMLTFAGLLLLYTAADAFHPDQRRCAELGQAALALGSAITLAAATLTRSNGTLNAPFLISFGIHTRSLLLALPLVLLVLLPLPLYLRYAWSLYCSSNTGLDNRPWCDKGGNIYGFIQKEYWNVGLFEYYTPNNIPNFLLAIPSMTIALTAVVRGLGHYCPQLSRAFSPKAWIEGVVNAAYDYKRSPFVFQLMVLTVFTLLCANVQVITRLLTGCPLYYWQLGSFYSSIVIDKKAGRIGTIAFSVYLLFHCVYFFIGPVMFCNFLPWT